jgi:hypothetical protein
LRDVQTGCPDRLQALIELYPEIGEELRRTVQKLRLEKINSRDYKLCKERICIVQSLRRHLPSVDMENKDFLDVILRENMKHVKEAVKAMGRGATPQEQPRGLLNKTLGVINSFVSSGPDSEFVDQTFREIETTASTISDAQFLAELDDIEELPIMKRIVADTRAAVLDHFRSLLTRNTKSLSHFVLQIQTNQCLAQVHREAISEEEQKQAGLRKKFIAEINDQTQAGHHS